MSEKLRESLSALRAVAPQLNKATDEAAAVVRAVEQLLGKELSLGISARSSEFNTRIVEIEGSQNEEAVVRSHLAYGRVAGKYRLFVQEEAFHEGSGEPLCRPEEIPWSSAPRETKLGSFAVLPELLASIASEAQRLASETAGTSEIIREFLAELARTRAEPAGDDSPPDVNASPLAVRGRRKPSRNGEAGAADSRD